MPIVTLTSDFAAADPAAVGLKGTLLRLCPGATLVDIAHGGRPFDVDHVGYVAALVYRRFPEDAVHLIWVNPKSRAAASALAVRAHSRWLVGPNNGVLTRVLVEDPESAAWELLPERLGSTSPASMGLGVLAPAAVRLAQGCAVEEFARPAGQVVRTALPTVHHVPGMWVEGIVEYLDGFGNAWTNITRADLQAAFGGGKQVDRLLAVHVCDAHIRGVAPNLQAAPPGKPAAFFNSSGVLQISVDGGSAATVLRLSPGNTVRAAVNDPNFEPFRG
jgi:hypothetical protein